VCCFFLPFFICIFLLAAAAAASATYRFLCISSLLTALEHYIEAAALVLKVDAAIRVVKAKTREDRERSSTKAAATEMAADIAATGAECDVSCDAKSGGL